MYQRKIAVADALKLRNGHTIRCLTCNRTRRIAPDDPFWAQWPPSVSLSVVEARAKCAVCGGRGAEVYAASPLM